MIEQDPKLHPAAKYAAEYGIRQSATKHHVHEARLRAYMDSMGMKYRRQTCRHGCWYRKIVSKTPTIEWFQRLRSIKCPDLHAWCASVVFWDLIDHGDPKLRKLESLAEEYNYNHNLKAEDLANALNEIGYPKPESRVLGNYK